MALKFEYTFCVLELVAFNNDSNTVILSCSAFNNEFICWVKLFANRVSELVVCDAVGVFLNNVSAPCNLNSVFFNRESLVVIF